VVETAPQTDRTSTGTRASSEPGSTRVHLENLTPAQIVAELDNYIIGQEDAKRAVAVALRNRYRRQLLPEELQREIQPRNILMIGPTGVGKTEIARRVAKIVDAPFVKVEATKFTEVGYVGRDVESIIRDLVEISISMLHNQRMEAVKDQASELAAQRLADLLVKQVMERKPAANGRRRTARSEYEELAGREENQEQILRRRVERERKRLLRLLGEHALDEEMVEIEVDLDEFDDMPPPDWLDESPGDELQSSLRDLLDGLMTRRTMRRRVPVPEAQRILTQQESHRLIDFDSVIDEAVRRVEETAVVFLDEIDKTIGSGGEYGPEVSGEGVQRDLLPIVEGSVVMTRYGPVRTDHILFVAAGAFHNKRPSDLIPELQGRFPIRVELSSLNEGDLYRILTEPQNSLTRQCQALIGAEDVQLNFTEDGLREIARLASLVNSRTDDIGARRLQTIMERVIEEVSFNADQLTGTALTIDRAYVAERVGDIALDDDLSDFIL